MSEKRSKAPKLDQCKPDDLDEFCYSYDGEGRA